MLKPIETANYEVSQAEQARFEGSILQFLPIWWFKFELEDYCGFWELFWELGCLDGY